MVVSARDAFNARVEVLQDMLQLLKETVTSRHAERLEQIVIALIAVEIGASKPPCYAGPHSLTKVCECLLLLPLSSAALGIITILVDLFS